MRIYELSKELGINSKELIALLTDHGFDVQTHMATLTEEMLKVVEARFKKNEKPVAPVSEESAFALEALAKSADDSQKSSKSRGSRYKKFRRGGRREERVAEVEAPLGYLILEPTSLSDIAKNIGIPANELILSLLKKGIVCVKNQLLSIAAIEEIAAMYEIEVCMPEKSVQAEFNTQSDVVGEPRKPIVAVIGHVDHGKTTLLDFIRKTRVASREKGGITQHLGAYTVPTSHGSIVFLDTPGHEAFGKIRMRGVTVADIAILIVAADDGIMPQTIEAIKQAKEAKVPIVVAINKVDKASPTQIEVVKRGLAQHDLLPEDWGGQITCVPISALKGDGVDELLEIIALQAEVLELKADRNASAHGFVLEAKMEKGRGPVATVILHEGSLEVGQPFICGSTYGKVNSITDEFGKKLKKVSLATPVQVAGFDKLPEAGDIYQAVSIQDYSRARAGKSVVKAVEAKPILTEQAINLIVKSDNKSSKEAILGVIEKLKSASDQELHVISSGVGNISEGDVKLALDTNAIIYGFHVKFEPSAVARARKLGSSVRLFDIIYKLSENIEELIESRKIVEEVKKEMGQAEVRKIFKIKGLGVIAGSYVKEGQFVRGGFVEAWRDNKKIGEAPIKSLERDKNAVKEVKAGYEFAFLTEGFNDWQIGDIAKCFIMSRE